METKAGTLQSIADPSAGLARFDDYDRRQLERVDRLLDAGDTYVAWAHGRPVATVELADAVADLIDVAQQAPYYPPDSNEISRTDWANLLELPTELLRDPGIDLDVGQPFAHEREGPDLGLGL